MVFYDLPESPYLKSNCLSRTFFWWLNPFFKAGYTRDLKITELYKPIPEDQSSRVGKLLATEWARECERCLELNGENRRASEEKENGQELVRASLARAIANVFFKQYMLIGLVAFIEECVIRIAQPLALGLLIRYFSHKEDYEEYVGWLLALAVSGTAVAYTFSHHRYFFGVTHIGMQVRVACCALLYRKAMKLSQSSLQKTAIGQMVNLLSNDVNRFDLATIFLHYLWIGPIQTAIVTAWVGRAFSYLRQNTAIRTDKRIRIMNEILSGIQVIKMYTWEKPFAALVGAAREDEISYIRKTANLRSLNMTLFLTSSKIIVFLTLLVYVLTGNGLTAELVFVTLALYNNVRLVMTLFFPSAVSNLAETQVSIRRLEDFLLLEERDVVKQIEDFDSISPNDPSNFGVNVKDVTAKWDGSHEENTIENINLTVKAGKILAGHVGAGKGSILHAILKELPVSKGTIDVHGKLAYAAQEPWLFSGSVRENILFGATYQKEWYNEVIEACALRDDFQLLPFGDQTLVGDRGGLLSGGPKARVTLARAAYANADVYLLDDPLSAVDANVGQHLFSKCINGLLSKKARILVTHQLQFLKYVDYCIIMENGRIQSEGTYSDLIQRGINFDQLGEAFKKVATAPATSVHNTPQRFSDPIMVRSSSVTSKDSRISRISNSSRKHASQSLVGVDKEFGDDDDVPTAGHKYIPNVFENVDDMEEIPLDQSPKKSVIPEKVHEKQEEQAETQAQGNISARLYFKYFRSGSSCCTFFILVLTNIICQIFFTGSDYWLSVWTRAEEMKHQKISMHQDRSDPWYWIYNSRDFQLYGYAVVVLIVFVTSWTRTIMFFHLCMKSSINLHKTMFEGIIRAPMLFFDTNPAGRILNRFSKDMGQIDDALPPTFFDAMAIFFNTLGTLIIISFINPILLIPVSILCCLFYFLRKVYILTARSVKRLEGIAKSSVFSHLGTSLYGITTIRAFQVENEMIHQFDQYQDLHTAGWYLFLATTRWFGIWLDWMAVILISIVTFSFMLMSSSGAEVGLAVSSAMMLTGMLQWGVRQAAEVENQMVSVERVMEYADLEPEADLLSTNEKEPPPDWPKNGHITFQNVSLNYGDHTVLRNISFIARASDKIGIVGRTGAGKSTLISVLFRITEPTGAIIIDDIDVTQIGLHDLRSKISIIPQEPVLFAGSFRKNLDPFGKFSDKDIWNALEESHLAGVVRQFSMGLEVLVSEGGSNFSIGQRQLICLARAILRNNRILVLDEATANVDLETDSLIQKTIQTKFKDCTVLTVAHRLHTVMECDKMLVLDAGRIMEFDEPHNLLQNENGVLRSLVEQTGKDTADDLFKQAKKAHDRREQESLVEAK